MSSVGGAHADSIFSASEVIVPSTIETPQEPMAPSLANAIARANAAVALSGNLLMQERARQADAKQESEEESDEKKIPNYMDELPQPGEIVDLAGDEDDDKTIPTVSSVRKVRYFYYIGNTFGEMSTGCDIHNQDRMKEKIMGFLRVHCSRLNIDFEDPYTGYPQQVFTRYAGICATAFSKREKAGEPIAFYANTRHPYRSSGGNVIFTCWCTIDCYRSMPCRFYGKHSYPIFDILTRVVSSYRATWEAYREHIPTILWMNSHFDGMDSILNKWHGSRQARGLPPLDMHQDHDLNDDDNGGDDDDDDDDDDCIDRASENVTVI